MTETFTGKAVGKSISLPEDMWAILERRREIVGVPVSRQIQDILEPVLARRTDDEKVPYRA